MRAQGIARGAWVGLFGLATALALVLLSCASAGAAKQDRPPKLPLPELRTAQLELEIDGGPKFAVSGMGRQVSISLSRGQTLRYANSTYKAEGRVAQERLAASFGTLGGVALDFRPGWVQRRPPARGCDGGLTVITHGVYVGRLRFESEDGQVAVDVRRVKGTFTVTPPLKCGLAAFLAVAKNLGVGSTPGLSPRANTSDKLDEIGLSVYDCGPTNLFATRPRGEAKPGERLEALVSVIRMERRGPVEVVRTILSGYDKTAFRVEPDLSTATLEPTAFFSGAGTFTRNSATGAGSWGGTLVAQFPGREVPLVDPGLRSKLIRIQSIFQILEGFLGPTCPRRQAP